MHKIRKFCKKFGYLILRKIFKFVATRCQILRLKCTKFNFGWGSAPDPSGGAYNALPGLVAGFKGATYKGREGFGYGKVDGTVEEREGEGLKRRGPPRVGSHSHVRNPEKYHDCTTDLIGGGGKIDVCSGRQTPSRCH